MSFLREVFLVPLLLKLGIHPKDPTFGRYLAENSPAELELEAKPHVRTRSRRVFFIVGNTNKSTHMHGYSKTSISGPNPSDTGNAEQQEYITVLEGEDVKLTQAELDRGKGKQWVYYKTWESDSLAAQKGKGRGCDIVLSHGMCDYGDKWASHANGFLELGFRIVAPDLASHGRSTGVHVHLESPWELTEGVHAVLTDLQRWSDPKPQKTFLSGSSLGGWTSLAYALRYPSSPAAIGGIFLIAPLIGVAPETMPPYPIYLLGLTLRYVAGRLPLSPAVKGKVSDDPRVEAESYADPRCYHGNLRIATGLSLLRGLQSLIPSAGRLTVPLRIAHGSNDRATDHTRSVEFVREVNNAGRAYAHEPDATCEIYAGYEHVMLKVGIDKADDEKRQRLLRDMELWFTERV